MPAMWVNAEHTKHTHGVLKFVAKKLNLNSRAATSELGTEPVYTEPVYTEPVYTEPVYKYTTTLLTIIV